MNLIAKIALGAGGTGATAASSYGMYEFIRPKNISEKLSWEGKIILDNVGDTDKEIWEKLKTKYSDTSESANKDKFKDKSTISTVEELKTQCKTVLAKKLSDEGAEEALKNARFWCVKDSSKLTDK